MVAWIYFMVLTTALGEPDGLALFIPALFGVICLLAGVAGSVMEHDRAVWLLFLSPLLSEYYFITQFGDADPMPSIRMGFWAFVLLQAVIVLSAIRASRNNRTGSVLLSGFCISYAYIEETFARANYRGP